jgi:hypothetical protein
VRWLGSWFFYWVGHCAYLIGDCAGVWPGDFWYEVYNRTMNLSSRIQTGRHGPWMPLEDLKANLGTETI